MKPFKKPAYFVGLAILLCSAYSFGAMRHGNFQEAHNALNSAIAHINAAKRNNPQGFATHAGKAIEFINAAKNELAIADTL